MPAGAAASKDAAKKDGTVIPGQYIVVLKDSVARPGAIAAEETKGARGDLMLVYRHGINGFAAQLSDPAIADLRRDPRVRYVTPNRRFKLGAFSQTAPTGISRTGATENPTADIDGQDDARVNVDVAVVDTGVDPNHPDLNLYRRANCVPVGEGFKNQGELAAKECTEGTGTDGYGHGTHVAGTVGAIDNGEGLVGVAPGARLWSVRVFAKDGYGTLAWWIAGVEYVTAHSNEIEVANLSFGCTGSAKDPCIVPPLEEAVEASIGAGVVYAVAAGNSSIDASLVSPARVPGVLTVSALADYDGKAGSEAPPSKPGCTEAGSGNDAYNGIDDTLARFSNWGTRVDIAAPGMCILSTLPTTGSPFGSDYGFANGTSMAAPHVAGMAALLASKSNPNSKPDVEALMAQIVDQGSQNWTDIWTWGNQDGGVEYLSNGHYTEGAFDSVQEPLLDALPAGGDTYTTRAKDREYRSAKLTGGINPAGVATTYKFEYGPTTAYGSTAPAAPASAGSGSKDVAVTQSVSGLKTNTLYHYRLVATNSNGTSYGKDKTFMPAKTFLVLAPDEVEASSVKLQSNVNPAGLETTFRYEYGTSQAYGSKTPVSSLGSGTVFAKAQTVVEGLKPLTEYHYRLAVTNQDGTFYSEDQTITTGPAAVTREPTGIDAHRVRLEGEVDPTGKPTTYQFEWGRSKDYGNVLPASPKSVGSGIHSVEVTELLTGLKPNTTYHYRVVAYNELGTTYGQNTKVTTGDSEFTLEQKAGSVEGTGCTGLFCEPTLLNFATDWGLIDAAPSNWRNVVSCQPPPAFGGFNSEALSVSLNNTTCLASFGLEHNKEATLKANGCGVEIHPGREGNHPNESLGSVDFGNSGCQGFSILYSDKSGANTYCEITLLPTRGIPATIREMHPGGAPARLEVEVEGSIRYSQKGQFCIDGTFDDGAIYAVWQLRGQHNGVGVDLEMQRAAQTAVTEPPSAVGPHAATLHGVVNPGGLSTNYWFEYVDAAAYDEDGKEPYAAGGKIPVSPASAGAGAGAVAVQQTVEGLKLHRTYHYRVVAESSAGITHGRDRTVTTAPGYLGSFGSTGSGPGQLSSPQGMAADESGHLWVADGGNDRIVEFDSGGKYIGQFGASGSAPGQLDEPSDVAVASDGDIWVVDRGNSRIQRFASSGAFEQEIANPGTKPGQLSDPVGIDVAPDGSVLVTDLDNGLLEFSSDGRFVRLIISGYFPVLGLAVGPDARSWVTEPANQRFHTYVPEGYFDFAVGGGVNRQATGDPNVCVYDIWLCNPGANGTGPGQFETPGPIEVMPSGTALVADASGRVQEFGSAGGFVTQFAGGASLADPAGIAAGVGGSIYVSDSTENRIQRWCVPVPLEVSTGSAVDIGVVKATLQGRVNPGCKDATYQFEYGTTTAYGSKVPASPQSIGSGADDVPVADQLEGLVPHTVYHYRLVATDEDGSVYGEDRTFTTPARHVTRLEAESHPASLAAAQVPSAKHQLNFANRSFECENATAQGSLAAAAPRVGLQPSYGSCQATVLGNKLPASLQLNGCSYVIELVNANTSPYGAALGVACAKEGEAIEAKVYQDAEKQAKGESLCTYRVAPQAGLSGVALSNSGSGTQRSVGLTLNVTKLAYTRSQGIITSCGGASGSASFTGTSSLSAAGQGLYVAPGEATTGLFLSGSQSEEPAAQPRVEAEGYPRALAGEQDGAHVLAFSNRSFECRQAYLDGSIAAAASQLGLQPSYGSCQATVLGNKYPASVEVGGCSWQLQVKNAGPPYAGTLGVACANGGEAIEARVYENSEKQAKGESLCTYRIAPQAGVQGVALANGGSGSARAVSASFAPTALAYTRVQGTVALCGTASGSASYTGAAVLRTFN